MYPHRVSDEFARAMVVTGKYSAVIVRVLSAIMLLPFLLLPLWATTCKNPMALSDDDFRPRLDGDPVFIGTVTGLAPPLSANLQAITVKVDRKWTNNVDDEVRV